VKLVPSTGVLVPYTRSASFTICSYILEVGIHSIRIVTFCTSAPIIAVKLIEEDDVLMLGVSINAMSIGIEEAGLFGSQLLHSLVTIAFDMIQAIVIVNGVNGGHVAAILKVLPGAEGDGEVGLALRQPSTSQIWRAAW
jgi:hypothetical protein